MQKKILLYALIAIGILISIYLTIVVFNSGALVCPNVGAINCENVLTSQYSSIFGIPVAILGLALLILAILMLVVKSDDTMIFLWSIAGAGAVAYSIISQALIGSVCLYCLSLDIVILALVYISNKK